MAARRPSVVRLLLSFVPLLCLAQTPPTIGMVEIYGAKLTPHSDIRKIVGAIPGGRLPSSKTAVESDLMELPNVENASLEAACCENGKIILYIGIEEKGSPGMYLNAAPTESLELPEPVIAAYRNFLDRVGEAGRTGVAGEDLSQGYSRMTYGPAREAQLSFVAIAKKFASELRQVLRDSMNEDHRAMAAYILGYSEDKKAATDDLAYALRDEDATVRGNAARALAAIAIYAQKNPAAGIEVEASPFIPMLRSAVWTDRNNASVALVSMTESRNPETLTEIRAQASAELTEMARWKHLPHALPAYILLGRSANIPESELQDAWAKGEREKIIVRASPRKTRPNQPDRP